MPRPTVEELNDARRRSGNLGGRPRKPTRDEAREKALEELTPKALRVLNQHLDEGGADAWRAALRVFEHAYGPPAERIEQMNLAPEPTDAELSEAIDRWRDATNARTRAGMGDNSTST